MGKALIGAVLNERIAMNPARNFALHNPVIMKNIFPHPHKPPNPLTKIRDLMLAKR
jgi:hypothetical protein